MSQYVRKSTVVAEVQALTPRNSDGRRSEHASACLMLLPRAHSKQEASSGAGPGHVLGGHDTCPEIPEGLSRCFGKVLRLPLGLQGEG